MPRKRLRDYDPCRRNWKISISISPEHPSGLISFGGGRVAELLFPTREHQREAARKLIAAGYSIKIYFEELNPKKPKHAPPPVIFQEPAESGLPLDFVDDDPDGDHACEDLKCASSYQVTGRYLRER